MSCKGFIESHIAGRMMEWSCTMLCTKTLAAVDLHLPGKIGSAILIGLRMVAIWKYRHRSGHIASDVSRMAGNVPEVRIGNNYWCDGACNGRNSVSNAYLLPRTEDKQTHRNPSLWGMPVVLV